MLKSAACESIWLTLEDDSVQFWTGFWCSLGNNQPVPRRCRRRTNAGALKPSGVSTARGSRGLAIGSLAIKSGSGLSGVFVKEVLKEVVRLFALAAGGLLEAVQHALIFQPFGPAGALENFAHDDQGAQAAFGLIVSRGHVFVAQEGEHLLLFGSHEPLTKVLGRFIAQGFAAQSSESTAQGPFLC